MRKIERQMNQAIINKNNWSSGNTMVTYSPVRDASEVYLHGNLISIIHDDQVQLMDGGWQSNTTKSRLNAILEGNGGMDRVYQVNFNWYVCTNGTEVPFESGMILK